MHNVIIVVWYVCIHVHTIMLYLCMSAEARLNSVHVEAMSESNLANSVKVNDVIMFSPYSQTPVSISPTCIQHWATCQIES